MKTILWLFLILTIAWLATNQISLATPPRQAATLETPGTSRTLNLPPVADNSPVISLGTAIDPATGQRVEGLAIIHRRNLARNSASAKTPKSSCYGYLSRGAKWKTIEPWQVNPTNQESLTPESIFNTLDQSVLKWEEATDGNTTNGLGLDILGPGSTTAEILLADTLSPDNQNEVYFADISDPDAIAVTIVWGIFGGPTFQRELVEWDQVYDDITFDWSAETLGVTGKMDLENIVTHELGHSVGLADLYNTCTEETMYGYAGEAETKKRDLNSGDIRGLDLLY